MADEIGMEGMALPAPSGAVPLDARFILGALRRHWLLVAAVTLLVTAVVATLARTAERHYTAWALIRLHDARTAMVRGLEDPTDDEDGRGPVDPVLAETQILQSRSLAKRVVEAPSALPLRAYTTGFPVTALQDVTLADVDSVVSLRVRFDKQFVTVSGPVRTTRVPYGSPLDAGVMKFTVARYPGTPFGTIALIPQDDAVDSLLAGLDMHPRTRTDLIDVSFTGSDRLVAQLVVNAAVQVFQEASADMARESVRARRDFLGGQLRQHDSLLNAAQAELSAFRARQGSYSARDLLTAEHTDFRSMEMQRMELDAERQTYEALLGDLLSSDGVSSNDKLRTIALSPGVAANPVISRLYAQLLEQQRSYDSLTTGEWRSAETSPDVQRLRTLLASTREQLVSGIRGYIASLEARIRVMDRMRASSAAALQQIPAREVEESRLETRMEALQKLGDWLRAEYQKADVSEVVDAGQIQVIDLASLPKEPDGFGMPVKVAAGLLIGLLLGGGAGLLRERLNTKLCTQEEAEALLDAPVLATIPPIVPRQKLLQRRQPDFRHRQRMRNVAQLFSGPSDESTSVGPRSYVADAYRVLRTNLQFAPAEVGLRTIAVTSPAPHDGKTTTAANIAAAFAEQGMRVLLVDCDLRRPRLHRLTSGGRSPGLTELILWRAEIADAVRPLNTGLDLLPAGSAVPNPAALLSSARMAELIDELSGSYEILVLDCPPALLGADATILAKLAGGVLFVVRAGHSERDITRDAVRQLRKVGAQVLGVAMNDPDAVVPRYGSYDAYAAYEDYYGGAASPREIVRTRAPTG